MNSITVSKPTARLIRRELAALAAFADQKRHDYLRRLMQPLAGAEHANPIVDIREAFIAGCIAMAPAEADPGTVRDLAEQKWADVLAGAC
jgi:hypothetical protein